MQLENILIVRDWILWRLSAKAYSRGRGLNSLDELNSPFPGFEVVNSEWRKPIDVPSCCNGPYLSNAF